ncbi:Phosphatidylinositol-glycan biosynthesis class F protein [Mycena sanguinolenta]|uniref:Phosphatidylinositol-glycan biosynthesis class F protein n=1 Tax=Mycena sanguinolenta TaxID=230812 RepID=A0A8H6YZT4_9AGAR|nr:Phosphatidylinositol-glycan biosynthesis class F protein [Mycena sanguinolenta]
MAKKSKPPPPPTEPSHSAPPPPYFPFASYTAVVGVHTTLLIFAALFLPRTPDAYGLDFLKPHVDPTQLTSQDRPQHPFLEALTRSPVATLAWVCAGAVVLQGWWGGWVREWGIEWALRGVGLERRVEKTRVDERKYTNLRNAWLATGAASLLLHVVLVLLGAPLLSHVWQTYLLALLLCILIVFPPAYTVGTPRDSVVAWLTWVRIFAEFSIRTPVERAMLYPALGALAGAWLGVIPIALDWDRPWQAYPLPPALGALAGYILASIAALTASAISFFAEEHLRSVREAAAGAEEHLRSVAAGVGATAKGSVNAKKDDVEGAEWTLSSKLLVL